MVQVHLGPLTTTARRGATLRRPPYARGVRIAITGGTGFVGGHLASALSSSGHESVLVARGVDKRSWATEVRALPGVEQDLRVFAKR